MTRGLELNVPQLPRELLSDADLVSWEVLYQDGTLLREAEGARYGQIERSRLRSFRLYGLGETLVETFPPPGATGHGLCYRRRTDFGGGERRVLFLVGWVPMGPVICLDAANMSYSTASNFHGHGDFEAPNPHPWEGEHFEISGDQLVLK